MGIRKKHLLKDKGDEPIPSFADDEESSLRPSPEKDGSILLLTIMIGLSFVPLIIIYFKDCGG